MRHVDVLVVWLDGLPHRAKRGHWPIWYELGAGQRSCVNCINGGHRPRVVKIHRRALSPGLLSL